MPAFQISILPDIYIKVLTSFTLSSPTELVAMSKLPPSEDLLEELLMEDSQLPSEEEVQNLPAGSQGFDIPSVPTVQENNDDDDEGDDDDDDFRPAYIVSMKNFIDGADPEDETAEQILEDQAKEIEDLCLTSASWMHQLEDHKYTLALREDIATLSEKLMMASSKVNFLLETGKKKHEFDMNPIRESKAQIYDLALSWGKLQTIVTAMLKKEAPTDKQALLKYQTPTKEDDPNTPRKRLKKM
jgi:hypothetical protein